MAELEWGGATCSRTGAGGFSSRFEMSRQREATPNLGERPPTPAFNAQLGHFAFVLLPRMGRLAAMARLR